MSEQKTIKLDKRDRAILVVMRTRGFSRLQSASMLDRLTDQEIDELANCWAEDGTVDPDVVRINREIDDRFAGEKAEVNESGGLQESDFLPPR